MIYTILSEPRSGSTNLYWWLKYSLPDFIVVDETSNPVSIDFRSTDLMDLSWVDREKKHIINEKFTSGVDFSKLLEISTKVVGLYRENEDEQIESFIHAEVTRNWGLQYIAERHIISRIDTVYANRKRYFQKLKSDFKEFINHHQLISFSYEDLYYRNRINELKEYLDLKIDTPFPYGKKLRVDVNKDKLI